MMNHTKHLCAAFVISWSMLWAFNSNASEVLQVMYDSNMNVTWIADGNFAKSHSFGVSGIDADGSMTFATAKSWISAMNAQNYAGYHDWRLPTTSMPDSTCSAQYPEIGLSADFNCTGSEMGFLFYMLLGGEANQPITTTHNAYYNGFVNLQPDIYWSSTTFNVYSSTWRTYVMNFDFAYGHQGYRTIDSPFKFHAFAVRTGEVMETPVPSAAWLFGTGLLGLVGVARRRNTFC